VHRVAWTQQQDPGKPIAPDLRAQAEQTFGVDLSRVRIHEDARARSWAEQLGAAAFTVGGDIYFGAGRYRPESVGGRRLIAHELTHVLQQSRSGPQIQRMPAAGGDPALAAEVREAKLALLTDEVRALLRDGAAEAALDRLLPRDDATWSAVLSSLTNEDANGLLRVAAARGDTRIEQKIRTLRGLTQTDMPVGSAEAAETFEASFGRDVADVRSFLAARKVRPALRLLAQLSPRRFDSVVNALTNAEVDLLLRKGGPLTMRATRDAIRASRAREVVVNTVLLSDAVDTIAVDFARANQIFAPLGIEIERGAHTRMRPSELQGTGGPFDAGNEEHGERLAANFADPRRITGFWVNGLVQSWRGFQRVARASAGAVVVETVGRVQDTFAHEVGHALGLPHLTEVATDPGADPNNLMASGGYRTTSGASGSDQLNAEQTRTILRNALLELGRRGVGR